MKAPLHLTLVCLGFALLSGPSRAATPAEELLRFVPPDVSFCLVLRDLRSHAAALGESPFAQAFRRSPLGTFLKVSPELEQLQKAEQFLEKSLGMSLDRIRDDVLGDAIVLAYRPGPPGKPEQEQGLVLLRARQAKTLAVLVERLNKVLEKGGVLKEVREVEHAGFKYTRRVEGDEVNFLHLRGEVLVFSGQEPLLREALALEKKTAAEEESAIGKSLRQLGADRALAALWVNPRPFDAELHGRLAKATSEEEKTLLKTFLSCWKAVDAAALTLSLTENFEVGLAVRGRPEAMPAAVRHFLDEAASPADLWARFSDDALLALAARTPASSLFAFLGAFQSKQAFEATQDEMNRGLAAVLGKKNLMKDVLPHVGPDWGICVTAPPRGDKAWFPSMLFALRVAAGDGTPRIDRAIVRQLDAFASLAILGFNKMRKDPLVRNEVLEDRLDILYFGSTAGQTMGLQPAFGLCDGYLVIASTPETVKRFAATAPGKVKNGDSPLLRLSLDHLRQYLKDRRTELTAALAEQHQLTPQQVGKHLDSIALALGLFDRLELTQKSSPGRVAFTLRLKPGQPLRK